MIVLITIILIMLVPFKNGCYEGFMDEINPKGCKKLHAKFSYLNMLDYVSDKPPCARGEYSCIPVECPPTMEKTIRCWKCFDYIDLPQNDFL